MGDGERPLEVLEAEICELAGHLAAAECRWLELLEEFDRREGWGGWGLRSCAHWVAWKCGLSLGAARERVRVARRLPGLPKIHAAFAASELTYAKVRAVTRVATPGREAALLEAARRATTPELERIVRALRPALEEKGELDGSNLRHERRFLRWSYDDDGSLRLRARLSPEEGALVLAALEEARTADRAAPGDVSIETSSPEIPWADALVTMARTALGAGGGADRPERCQVMVVVDEAVLSGQADEGTCHVDDGPALAPETARRLACDAAAIRVRVRGRSVLDIGRKSPVIPIPIRRALRRRDGGCRYPGCTNRRFVDGHHVRHWSRGGPTALENLVLLCRRHHRLVHEGGAHIVPAGDGLFDFFRRDGRPIPASPTLGPRRSAISTVAGLPRSLDEGQGHHLGLTIDALLALKAIDRVELGAYGRRCLGPPGPPGPSGPSAAPTYAGPAVAA